MSRESPAKSRSRLVKSMIEEDVDVSKSAILGVYGDETKDERNNSKSPIIARKIEKKEEG